jgi:lysophospholipase L1-like esterase
MAVVAAVALALGGGALVLSNGDRTSGDATSTGPRDADADADELVPGAIPEAGVNDDADAAENEPALAPTHVDFDVESVAVVGDSITEGSAASITAVLTAEGVDSIDVRGRARRRIEVGDGSEEQPLSGLRELHRLLAEGAGPDVWVIALGTNDVSLYPDRESYERLVDAVLERIPEDAPLVWVDVYRPGEATHTAMFNDVVAERLDDRGNAAVAPWHAFASSPEQRILSGDDLHPNDAGNDVFASVIAVGIDDALDD